MEILNFIKENWVGITIFAVAIIIVALARIYMPNLNWSGNRI